MCGIVGAVTERNAVPILLEGLHQLEYRGYDSSGIAVIRDGTIQRKRALGKVAQLEHYLKQDPITGGTGIAHTRWATHGKPSEKNAHPHCSNERITVVHNGILENHAALRQWCIEQGCTFESETDTEVIAHVIYILCSQYASLLEAVQVAVPMLEGAFALGIIDTTEPHTIIAVKQASPLTIGIGIGEHFIASDVTAIASVTSKYIFLEDGDIAVASLNNLHITDSDNRVVFETGASDNQRAIQDLKSSVIQPEKGTYRHFMLKEIHEQGQTTANTLDSALSADKLNIKCFGNTPEIQLRPAERLCILACGTSYHAGLVARYWFEDIINMPVSVEIASEFRYRNPVITPNTLYISLSQSGETADTISAIELVKKAATEHAIENTHTLAICNTANSTLTRMSDIQFITHAGYERGVASTKAFSCQLVALALLLVAIGEVHQKLDSTRSEKIIDGLRRLPALINQALQCEQDIAKLALQIASANSVIFLGRGSMYPIAMEGALKLKEISYIHAEAYAAGELKHGPLALVDENMPVVAVAPNDELLAKLQSNLQEVLARGGKLFVFEDEHAHVGTIEGITVLPVTSGVGRITSPIIFNIPLQLLAYHVALIRGTDIDQPRNLAKSVTVE